MHLGCWQEELLVEDIVREGQGKWLYRDALAIACAADGDEMPIKKPEFDEDELRLVLCFTVTRLGALAD